VNSHRQNGDISETKADVTQTKVLNTREQDITKSQIIKDLELLNHASNVIKNEANCLSIMNNHVIWLLRKVNLYEIYRNHLGQ
jgi:hypothetical protein